MQILGFEFGRDRSREINKLEKQIDELKYKSYRPLMGLADNKSIGRIPFYPISPATIYEVAEYSDVIRTIHFALGREIFRQGTKIQEKFAVKCTDCGHEHEFPTEQCEQCNSTNLRKPDSIQKEILENLLRECNDNGQGLLDVFRQNEDDLNTIDKMFTLICKDYFFTTDGELAGSIPVEIVRVHPLNVELLMDSSARLGYNESGDEVRTCLEHRNNKWVDKVYCPVCGKKLVKACFKCKLPNGETAYYTRNEIYQTSKYKPSLSWGQPPILAVWMKVATLMNMDRFILDTYAKQRPPRGLLFINTPNINSVQKAWAWMLDQFKINPHMIPPVPVESQNKGNIAQFIDFMKSPEEMQFLAIREEMRRVIGAEYGVMPLFQADLSQSGGLNNEGLQVTVTNRSVEEGQRVYNEGQIPWILKQFNITDYILLLKPNEEQDEMADEQLQAQKINNAMAMQQMGFDVTLSQEGEFEFEPMEEPVSPPSNMGEVSNPLMDDNPNPSGTPNIDLDRDSVSSDTSGVHNPSFSPERRRLVENLMDKTLHEISKQEGKVLDVHKKNEGKDEFIEFIKDSMYQKNFEGLSLHKSNLIRDYVLRNLKKKTSLKKISEGVKRIAGKDFPMNRADTIVTTETQAITTKMREWSYKKTDPEGENRYKWIGPNDHRTTPVCREITDKTRKGVTLKELKKIVHDVGKKYAEKDNSGFTPRDFSPHFNCRHTFVKVFG